ncbi:hypothetical protein [Methanosphaera sp.]|nr:hypothetical protein [Methanosphaera sp.]
MLTQLSINFKFILFILLSKSIRYLQSLTNLFVTVTVVVNCEEAVVLSPA